MRVKWRDGHGEVKSVLGGAETGLLHAEMAAEGIGLGFGLVEGCISLGQGGYVGVVGGFFGVEVLLGHDAGGVEALGALPVEAFLLEIGFGALDVGLGGLFGGDVGVNVGFCGGDGGLLADDIGFLLHVFNGGHGLALFHEVALFDVEVGDAAHGGSAKIGVGSGLDLSGAADDGGEILAGDSGGENLGVAGLLPVDEDAYQYGG